MQKTKNPTQSIKLILIPLLMMTSYAVHAAEMPPAPGILDSYQCTYNPGKNINDLMAARDFYVKQTSKGEYKAPAAYIWELEKGNTPVDVVWFDLHENLSAYAASADAASGSTELAAANARFETVITCQAGLGSVQTIQQRGELDPDAGPAFVSSSACMVKHGYSEQDVADLVQHIAGVAAEMGDKAPSASYIATPITSGPDTPDLYVFSVNPNVTAWSQFVAELTTTPAGQMLGRHFNKVLDCSMSMWTGQWAIAPQS
jgi:hypothetical protein